MESKEDMEQKVDMEPFCSCQNDCCLDNKNLAPELEPVLDPLGLLTKGEPVLALPLDSGW